jgi:hypothetical protein
MAGHVRVGRGRDAGVAPLVVASLVIAAALVVSVGQIKSASIQRAYRHTQYSAASVLSVDASRIASVRFLWAGKPRIGKLDVAAVTSVDRGDRLALRVSDGGRQLQLETPFYGAVYPWTAAGLTLAALVLAVSSRRSQASSGRQVKRLLPAELSRPHRRYRVR